LSQGKMMFIERKKEKVKNKIEIIKSTKKKRKEKKRKEKMIFKMTLIIKEYKLSSK
jgi:hypothetical protein